MTDTAQINDFGRRLRGALLLLLWAASACDSTPTAPEPGDPAAGTAATAPPTTSPRVAATVSPEARALQSHAEAETELLRVLALPGLPGAEAFEKQRPQLVARAKSEPVFFVHRPGADPGASKGIAAQREYFLRTDFAWRTMRDLRKRFRHNKPVLRQLFLSDGYLYSESPNHAFTIVSLLRPSHLFDGEPIWIQRGERTFEATVDDKGEYFFRSGSEAGKRVRLLHLDRVGSGEPPPPLHVDFRSLRYKLFFDRAKVRHITKQFIVADLRYQSLWIPSVLRIEGAQLELTHEVVPPAKVEALNSARKQLERQLRAISQMRAAMRASIDEGLPFDEPKTEFGQEDGRLRRLWRQAYNQGKTSFRYNDDRYSVFGRDGQPLVPQVCIDFMVDTFERASGSWWLPRSAGKRERSAGKLDLGDVSREDLRRTQFFVNFARDRKDWFDVLTFPEHERVELGYKDRFFDWLMREIEHFDSGDIILIRGLTPWDEVDEHTHSFFIYETDPLTGIPIAIAGNAGPANLWSWETEARRTPHRTLRTRIRPKLEWLETFIDTSARGSLSPPELISGNK